MVAEAVIFHEGDILVFMGADGELTFLRVPSNITHKQFSRQEAVIGNLLDLSDGDRIFSVQETVISVQGSALCTDNKTGDILVCAMGQIDEDRLVELPIDFIEGLHENLC